MSQTLESYRYHMQEVAGEKVRTARAALAWKIAKLLGLILKTQEGELIRKKLSTLQEKLNQADIDVEINFEELEKLISNIN